MNTMNTNTTTPADVELLAALSAGDHEAARLAANRLPDGAGTPELVRECLAAGDHEAARLAAYRLPYGAGTPGLVRECFAAGALEAAWEATAKLPDGVMTSHPSIGAHSVWSFAIEGERWLRVGCELHSAAEWVRDADEIFRRNGSPGLADETRALAERLIAD